MASLLDGVKGMMTDAIVNKVAGMIGIESKTATSAIKMFLPAVIGGLINKGSSESGAGGLLDIFKNGGFGSDKIEDIGAVLGDKTSSDSWLESGADLLGNIFGDKQSGLLDGLLGSTGLKKAGGSMLLKFLAPLVVNKLAGMVFKNGWGAKKLSSYLGDQKSSIAGIPGLGGLLGFADSTENSVKTAAAATATAASTVTHRESEPSGGGGWWKWLLPLLIGAGLIWYLTKDGCNSSINPDGDKTEMTDGTTASDSNASDITGGPTANNDSSTGSSDNSDGSDANGSGTTGMNYDYSKATMLDDGSIADGSGKVIHSAGSYGLDADGNLIDDKGNILARAAAIPASLLKMMKGYLGKYAGVKLSLDADGNLVDSDGKIIFKKGEFTKKGGFYYDSAGNKLGRIWAKIVKAINDAAGKTKEAAEKTVDAMKGIFSDMLSKKEGAATNYALSNIEWQKDNNRISNFSKAEVEGLAAAMKASDNGKVVVNVFTNDGKDDKENMKLSKARAEVVHDMLVTLGVADGRISFKGMGTGANKVDISSK